MYGSLTFQIVFGKWDHYGTLETNNIPLPDGAVIPRGTHFDVSAGDEHEAALASGSAVGVTVQDIDADGLTGLQGFQDFTIGKVDRNVKRGRPVSLRVPNLGAVLEFEGLGTCGVGNLVVTSGTGAISASTAKGVELSAYQGSLYIAQSGDVVLYLMEDSSLTPATVGNVRVRVKAVGHYLNP